MEMHPASSMMTKGHWAVTGEGLPIGAHMTIKIIEDGPDIVLTQSEAEHLRRQWTKCCQYHVDPPTFEEFVRGRKNTAGSRQSIFGRGLRASPDLKS